MPSWWGKSSPKDAKKKANKEGIIDAIQRKLKISSDLKSNTKLTGSRRNHGDTVLEKGSRSQVPSRSPSPSPSTQVSRSQSFVEKPHSQPLPLPIYGNTNSEISATSKPIGHGFLPLLKPVGVPNSIDQTEADGDIETASIYSPSSIDSDDPSDSRVLSPLESDWEIGNRTTTNSPRSVIHKDQSPKVNERNSKISLKPPTLLSNNHIPSTSTSPKRGHMRNLLIPRYGAFLNAPDSSMSSPSRSSMRGVVPEQISNVGFWPTKLCLETASAHCSSPGSGHNSAHNSMGFDTLGLFWPQSRCSPECSPIPSPSIASPGPSSRIHSGAVTPLHPRAGGPVADSSNNWPDDGKQQSHRLPLPPITVSSSSPFSIPYSAAVTSSTPRSSGRVENLASPGSRWKKGRLLGRGTFGHVYLGFNSESGEMCAMKEVTLFSDDAKSKESVQQLGQEISVLSRLRHPNIVQYFGSETVDDKLYIYLEYVSGGSIYKLLQEYGQFGEIVIRNYTQQILSGLSYLHAKNTVHRDIKGANILVDPSGRVKLADFGMAKHISGQSCPLSFKGSPYWMAPEVIKNSNGCNLSVDIWSLGCTVLEMATTKPPWSQYEGVAAMFKIGNSKDLPAIPDHLSEDGKDFVRLCLQRNPLHRPTAAQLFEHPFVKNASQLERILEVVKPSEALTTVTNPVRSTGKRQQGRSISFPNPDGIDIYKSRSLLAALSSSETHTPRNMSCSVSPVGSPLLHSIPKHASGRMSPSPISSPLSRSGSSTPLNGINGAIPFHLSKQPTYPSEGTRVIQTCQNNLSTTGGTFYNEPKPGFFPGISQTSNIRRDVLTSNNNTANMIGKSNLGDPGVLNGELFLADCVSHQLLRDHLKLDT